MSNNWWANRQTVILYIYIYIYVYDGILLSHRKEWDTSTYYVVGRPWKYYGKWKKPDNIKGHILHDSIYMKYPE